MMPAWSAVASVRKALTRRAQRPMPLPSGPLSRFLMDPQRFLHRLAHAAWRLVMHIAPVLIVLCVIGIAIGVQRHLRLRTQADREPARRIAILPPPEIEPEAAQLLWMGLHALLRPWWRRVLSGQPHLAWEITARGDDVEVAVWVPRGVPATLVERAVKVAFPGAQTRVGSSDPLKEAFDDAEPATKASA